MLEIKSLYKRFDTKKIIHNLDLTIDKAPTIPNERAMLPAIIVVITYVIMGNNKKVAV